MPSATGSLTAKRILVYGSPGAGKTHAAQQISAHTGIPVTFVDELIWNPGWVAVPDPEQRRRFAAVVAQDSWILDGAFGAFRDLVEHRTDLIVALDYPRLLSLQRLLRRSIANVWRRTPICGGNTESLRLLLRHDSILVWHFQTFRRTRRRMRDWAAAADGPPTLLFSRPRHLNTWIAQIAEPGSGKP